MLTEEMKKTLYVILIAATLLSLGCVEREECTLPRDCEGRAHPDCISDWLCINGECVWGCGNCSLSMCDCKCYLPGETPEEKTGKICGINCLGEYNISGCEYRNGKCIEIYSETEAECTQDADCGTGGCSGQVCGLKEKVKDIITTCEYLPEYGCLKHTACKCIDGRCQWEENDAYIQCMENLTVGLPNPASVYCVDQGFELELREDENGSYGVCVFPDGSECEEWAFYRGECNITEEKENKTQLANPASVYCVDQGFELELREDENGSYGVCVFSDGSECEEWAFYLGECNNTTL